MAAWFSVTSAALGSDLSAEQLTDQGHQYLNQGNPSQAFQTWEKALQLYKKRGDRDSVLGVLSNQSEAQQQMGQYSNACWTLIIGLDLDAELCRSYQEPGATKRLSKGLEKLKPATPNTLAALQSLGITSRELWQLDQSVEILSFALAQSEQMEDTLITDKIRLSLANTYQAIWRTNRERYRLISEEAVKSRLLSDGFNLGLRAFQELENLSQSENLAMEAKINWLQYYEQLLAWIAEDGEYPDLIRLQQQVQPHAEKIISELEIAEFDHQSFTKIKGIYARLKIAENLYKLYQHQKSIPGLQSHPLRVAALLSKKSLAEAQSIHNDRAESQALTLAGKLYMETQQNQQAYNSLVRAQNLGISNFAPDLVYQAAWPLAKLNQRIGKPTAAMKSYENAIAALEEVRGNLLSVNQSLQFSFREQIEPIYQEYLEQLMAAPQPDLEKVIQTSKTLQIVRLENFLQCGKLTFLALKDQENLPTVFYFLDLGDQLEVIVRQNGKLKRYPANLQTVKKNVAELQNIIQNPRFEEIPATSYLPFTQALYKDLIEPGASLIGADQRMIVVTNGLLDNIPIGFLHDGSQHLLEKYEIATSLGAQLETQRPSTQKPKILFAGASNSPTSQALKLPQLLEVEQEADSISEVFGASRTKALVNQSFTLQNIKEKLPSYSYLHLATHGQFSSNPQDTYLVAWQEKIGVQQLEQLILERTSNRSKGLDLLFLSACQSAKGDSRSELGLAGLATQAGAKNAIATLWQVNSRSTSLLAAGFYQRIAKGQPYAQALQQAQLELMHSKDYKHPYFWAPFVLLGGL